MDVGDGTPYGGSGLMNSSIANSTNPLSKFHRSVSMGQGWSTNAISNRYSMQPDENYENRVVLRRKNNKMCDPGKYIASEI